MKRILNLNESALPVLRAIFIVGLGLPLGLKLSAFLLARAGLPLPILDRLVPLFCGLGGMALGLFFMLVVVEQIQDHLLYQRYLQERGQALDGECPFCGNRRIQAFQHFCPVCGKDLQRSG